MRRFFVHPEDVGARELYLRGAEASHLARVLRLGPGAQVVAFDGRGHEYVAAVERLEAEAVVCRILHRARLDISQTLSITLGQGLTKADKFEWVLQKATELGVAEIVPLVTERVIPQLSQHQLATKLNRWQKLAREACKQCGRATLPQIRKPTPLQTFFASCQSLALKLLLWERQEQRSLRSILAASEPVASAAIVIGPEGGLTEQEVAAGEAHGFVAAGLGKRILRAETAGVIVVALLQYQFGDLG